MKSKSEKELEMLLNRFFLAKIFPQSKQIQSFLSSEFWTGLVCSPLSHLYLRFMFDPQCLVEVFLLLFSIPRMPRIISKLVVLAWRKKLRLPVLWIFSVQEMIQILPLYPPSNCPPSKSTQNQEGYKRACFDRLRDYRASLGLSCSLPSVPVSSGGEAGEIVTPSHTQNITCVWYGEKLS